MMIKLSINRQEEVERTPMRPCCAIAAGGFPAPFSHSAIELGSALKVLLNLLLRQAAELAASQVKLADLDWGAPNYSTFCRHQNSGPRRVEDAEI